MLKGVWWDLNKLLNIHMQNNINRFFLPLSDSYSRSKFGIGLLAKVKTFANCGCVWIMRVLFHIGVLSESWFVGQSQDHFLSIDIDYEAFHVNGSRLTGIIKLVVPKPMLSWFRGKRLGKYIGYIGIYKIYVSDLDVHLLDLGIG